MPKILVVEDDNDLQFLYDTMLSRCGYDVTAAHNIVDAMVRLTNELYDIIILDMNMPDLPGIRVIEFARDDARLKHVPIVVVSANEHWKPRVNNLGVREFMVKPVTMQELTSTVERVLHNGNGKR
jgi:DNA-binding response OmpR family regulator